MSNDCPKCADGWMLVKSTQGRTRYRKCWSCGHRDKVFAPFRRKKSAESFTGSVNPISSVSPQQADNGTCPNEGNR